MIRKALRMLGYLFLALIAAIGLVWLLAPSEPVDFAQTFDPATLGDDPAAAFVAAEASFDDIVEGSESSIVWAGDDGAVTDVAIVYLHGFSATPQEIRPTMERVSPALGANIIYVRLTGHGRDGPAMATGTVAAWTHDADRALALAERIGRRTIVVGTSTGATLLTGLLANGRDDRIDGAVMISPNYRIGNPASAVLTLPGARWWVPVAFGAERSFEPHNEDHARMWTTRYPTEALFPMAPMVKEVRSADFTAINTPALFLFSPLDGVVDHAETRRIAAEWAGPVTISEQVLAEGDDPFNHVIAGDALSPSRTAAVAEEIAAWIDGL